MAPENVLGMSALHHAVPVRPSEALGRPGEAHPAPQASRTRAGDLRRSFDATRKARWADASFARVRGVVDGAPVTALVLCSGDLCGDASLVRRARPTPGPVRAGEACADPLGATLTLARACDIVTSVEVLRAGQRGGPAFSGLDGGATMHMTGGRSPSSLSIVVLHDAEVHWVYVHLLGELDLAGCERLRRELASVAGSPLLVDLGLLTFIDAAGLNALIHAKREVEARGCEFRIHGAQGIVRRVFEITNEVDLLND